RPTRGSVTRSPGVTIGYVPQLETVNWDFPLTVAECVLMGRPGRGLPWPTRAERAAVGKVLERLGIGHLALRHIRALSGGQQPRWSVAGALSRSPSLPRPDEPTTGVDFTSRHDMLHLLGELNAGGTAILLTTHDLNGVAAPLPRLVALNGTVVAEGA